jgi:hypothetical protein
MNLEALKSFLEDPKNVEEMARHFKEQALKRLHNMDRLKRFFDDDESFEKLVVRTIEKNDQRWAETYHKGVEPQPWNILHSLYHIAEEGGVETEPVDGFTESFPSQLTLYRGLTFAITHGQGSVMSIYKGTDLIYRD